MALFDALFSQMPNVPSPTASNESMNAPFTPLRCSPSAQVGQIGVIEEERVVGSS
jgi:hypothetical protein